MMWALEYDPDLFSTYEDDESAKEILEGSKGKTKSRRQCGKFERNNLRNGGKNGATPLPISIFLVASVLKDKSAKLTEARGLDEVVKVFAAENSFDKNLCELEFMVNSISLIITVMHKFITVMHKNYHSLKNKSFFKRWVFVCNSDSFCA